MAHNTDLDELGTNGKFGEQHKRSIPMGLESQMRAKKGSGGEGKGTLYWHGFGRVVVEKEKREEPSSSLRWEGEGVVERGRGEEHGCNTSIQPVE